MNGTRETTGVAAVALTAAALAGAAPAQAVTGAKHNAELKAQFIALQESHGWEIWDPDKHVRAAVWTCTMLLRKDGSAVADALTASNPRWNRVTSTEFVSRTRWSTTELQQDFEVLGFAAPLVLVKRKSDGLKGLLEFKHGPPRVYFGWQGQAS